MPNTFDAVPQSRHVRSRALLELDEPRARLETIMEEANLQRGSLREQDGYTIPFREGGQVRIRIFEEGAETHGPALEFLVDGPTEERRGYIESEISQTVSTQLVENADLEWDRS